MKLISIDVPMLLNLLTWLRQYLSGFCTVKLLIFSNLHTALFGRKLLCMVHAYTMGSSVPSHGQSRFEVLLHRFVSSSQFILSFICNTTDSRMFILFELQSNSTSFCCSNCSNIGHWVMFRLVPVSL